jgi:hypothetical protein
MQYHASLDEAWKGDTFAFTIGHREGERVVFDLLRGFKRQRPEFVFDEISSWCKKYGVRFCYCDQYSSEPTKLALRERGVMLTSVPFTGQSKPEIYSKFKAALSVGGVELLDHKESLGELRALQVKIAPSGQPKIEAAHDDYADVLALLVYEIGPSGRLPFLKYEKPRGEPSYFSQSNMRRAFAGSFGERRGSVSDKKF